MSLPRSRIPQSMPASASGIEKSTLTSFFKGGDKDSSYLEQVVQKLQKHPEYQKHPTAELKQLAKKLTNTELLEEYFGEYLHVARSNVLMVTGGDMELSMVDIDQLKVSTDGEQSAISINVATPQASFDGSGAPDPYSHIKNVASFPVKLYLTTLPPDAMIVNNSHASMLETKCGTMHASLQIGHTMIEWTPHHLVIPHYNLPSEPVIKTDITRATSIASDLRAKAREYKSSRRGSITGEIDLIFEVSKSLHSMIKKVIKVIATWNRYKYYNAYNVNSQHFMQNLISVLGIEELPLLQHPDLSEYVDKLKHDFKSARETSFRDHAELDSHIREKIGQLKTSDMEYLLTEYYRFHVASRMGCIGVGEWKCEEPDCQMQHLEREIDGKELLIASLRLT